MKIVEFKNEKGQTEFYLVGAETWEDFDTLVSILKENVEAQPIDVVDGPDVRLCSIDHHGIPITLTYYDGLGNYLSSPDMRLESVKQVRSLAHAILKSFCGA